MFLSCATSRRLRLLLIALCLTAAPAVGLAVLATYSTENGNWIATRGEVRIMVVFAETDYRSCGGGFTHVNWDPKWPAGELPTVRDTHYYDQVAGSAPRALLTDYYDQMSFGRYMVLGDYYGQLVTIDCRQMTGTGSVINALNSGPQPITTAHGYTMDDFDLLTDPGPGLAKVRTPDNRQDVVLIVWRNVDMNPYSPNYLGECAGCFTGSIRPSAAQIGGKTGVNNLGSFASWNADTGIVAHEYMHGIFGGNNFHIADGAGYSTFHVPQGSYGMTAHSPASSNVASGWDRNQLGWKPPAKRYLISALDGLRREARSDITIGSHPNGAIFILRDFVGTGDAVRIKLPHISWNQLKDKKNQYLWLENHQRLSRFDINDTFLTCRSAWTPGIYAQLQVGKDVKSEDVDGDGTVDGEDLCLNGCSNKHPNAQAGWMFPITAQGSYDWYYRLDKAVPPANNDCQWGNTVLPLQREKSLPNPFTGFSELYTTLDSDSILTNPMPSPRTLIPFGDGALYQNEVGGMVMKEITGDTVAREFLPADRQAFSFANGTSRLALDTNPAPVSVYTMTSQWQFGGPAPTPIGGPDDFENRTIWLNGLSIQILEENVDRHGAVKVRIRWDEFTVNRDVRWTGDIVLENDNADPRGRQSKIVLRAEHNLYLDRGLSPTQDFAESAAETIEPFGAPTVYPSGLQAETGRLFTRPTVFTVKSGTKLHLERNARLWVQNGSTLHVEAGAEVQLEPGARLANGAGSGAFQIDGIVRMFGDLDGNECVDGRDFRILLRESTGPGVRNPFLDLNEDGYVNVLDALKLTAYFTNRWGARCD